MKSLGLFVAAALVTWLHVMPSVGVAHADAVVSAPEAASPMAIARRVGAVPADAVVLRGLEHELPGLRVQLPQRANEALRLSTPDHAWMELTPEAVRATPVVLEEGAAVYHDVAPATDVVFVATKSGLEDLRILRDVSAEPSARYRFRTSASIASAAIENGRFVARDAGGAVRLAADAPIAMDAAGARRAASLSLDGDRLVVALDVRGLRHPIVVDPFWSSGGTASAARFAATLTLLPSGKVLVAGGGAYSKNPASTAELWDPATTTFTATGSMATERGNHRAILLDTTPPKVLVVAGEIDFTTHAPTSSCEMFNTATGTWSAAAPLAYERYFHSATKLPGGKLLVAGGLDDSGFPTSTADLYDPATNTWKSTTPMPMVLAEHRAVLLPSGRVMLVGGETEPDTKGEDRPRVALVYDAAAATWTKTGLHMQPRYDAAVGVIGSKVIVAGGSAVTGYDASSTAEIWDPTTNAWTTTTPLPSPRTWAASVVLNDGKLLVAGGTDTNPTEPVDYASTLLFDPTSAKWLPGGDLAKARAGASATLLADGRVFVLGASDDAVAADAEVFSLISSRCTKDTDCTTGHCADSVCCNSACAGQCEACNQPGSEGDCVAMNGPPVAGRAPCEGLSDPSICKRKTCGGTDREACVFPTTMCSKRGCADGFSSRDAVCKDGTCPESPTSCAGYACTADATCRTTCAAAADCVDGYGCDPTASKCVPVLSSCDAATNTAITRDGARQPCGVYKCIAATGACAIGCRASEDCAGGAVCDAARCVAPPAPAEEESGCAVGSAGAPAGSAALVALMAAGLARRRRRATRARAYVARSASDR